MPFLCLNDWSFKNSNNNKNNDSSRRTGLKKELMSEGKPAQEHLVPLNLNMKKREATQDFCDAKVSFLLN